MNIKYVAIMPVVLDLPNVSQSSISHLHPAGSVTINPGECVIVESVHCRAFDTNDTTAGTYSGFAGTGSPMVFFHFGDNVQELDEIEGHPIDYIKLVRSSKLVMNLHVLNTCFERVK